MLKTKQNKTKQKQKKPVAQELSKFTEIQLHWAHFIIII